MEIDGAFVDGRVRPLSLDEAEQSAGGRIHDREGVAVSGTKREPRRGVVAPLPDEARRGVLELRELGRSAKRFAAESCSVLLVERRLVRRREDVRVEDPGIRMIDDGGLDSTRQECLGLSSEELVERILARDQDRQPVAAPARPTPLLAKRRDGPREPNGDRAVEEPDVDPELERVGCRDAEELSFDEPSLDVAALLRGVTRAVRGKAVRGSDIDPL